MTEAITTIFQIFYVFMRSLDGLSFELYGFEVKFYDVVFVFLVIGMVISMFWKGARS